MRHENEMLITGFRLTIETRVAPTASAQTLLAGHNAIKIDFMSWIDEGFNCVGWNPASSSEEGRVSLK